MRSHRFAGLFLAAGAGAFVAAWVFGRWGAPALAEAVHPGKRGPTLFQTLALAEYLLGFLGPTLLAVGAAACRWPFERWPLGPLTVCVLALAAAVRFSTPDMALDTAPAPDGTHYTLLSMRLVGSGEWTIPFGGDAVPSRMPPGASIVMAFTQALRPTAPGWGVFAVWLCSLASLALIWRLGAILHSSKAGAVAALLLALSPMHGFYSRQLMAENIWIAFVLGALALWFAPARGGAARWAGGVLLGLGWAIKAPHLFVLAPAIALAAWWFLRRPGLRKESLLFMLGAICGALATPLYNAVVFGDPMLTGYHIHSPEYVGSGFSMFSPRYLFGRTVLGSPLGNVPYYALTLLGLDPRPERMPWLMPVALLSAVAVAAAGRAVLSSLRSRRLAAALVVLPAAYLAAMLLYCFQDARLLAPVLPALFLLAGPALADWMGRRPAAAPALLAAAAAVLAADGLAIVRVETAGLRIHERALMERLARVADEIDLLVSDADPALLSHYGLWTRDRRLVPLALPGDVHFAERPGERLRAKGVLVEPYRGTDAVVREALAAGRRVAVWVRWPHWAPRANADFAEAFDTEAWPEAGVPGLLRVKGLRSNRANAGAVLAPPP